MKASRFTDAQKAFIIKQGEDGTPVAEICREAGISQATYFNWKKKCAGMMLSEMRRLRELEHENKRLKKIVADRPPDKAMLQDVIRMLMVVDTFSRYSPVLDPRFSCRGSDVVASLEEAVT